MLPQEAMKGQLIPLLLLVLTIHSIPCIYASPKDPRLLSLLNVVTFRNSPCAAASSTMSNPVQGTCFSTSECSSKGGRVDGSCASGFGACCVFSLTACTGTVTNNCTYIMNPNSPGNFNGMDSMCRYTFGRGDGGVCRIRLDFQNFVINDPTAAGECLVEKLTVTSTSRNNLPSFCGTLTNQHMFITTGMTGDLGTLTINFDTALPNTNRRWNIKVTRLHCSDTASLPPDGCLQYFTGLTGNVKNYNFGKLLASQFYNTCIRQERNFCSLQLVESSTATPLPFNLSPFAPTACTKAQLLIANSNPNIICGKSFRSKNAKTPSQIIVDDSPFILGLYTKAKVDVGTTGFNLNYNQIPC